MPLITGTSYPITGRTAGVSYNVEVKAVDTAGNEGAAIAAPLQMADTVNDYSTLTNPYVILDFEGLVIGTDNAYGTVDGTGKVTMLKSIAPAPYHEFTTVGTGLTLTATGLEFAGATYLRNTELAKWLFLNELGATYSINMVLRAGNIADPNAAYGIYGTNGTSASKIGTAFFFDDRVSGPKNNSLQHTLTNGSQNVFAADYANSYTPNQAAVLSVHVGLGTANRNSLWRNNALLTATSTAAGTGVTSNPTHGLEIGACGNGILPLIGNIRQFVICKGVQAEAERTNFVNWLMGRAGL